MLAHTSVSLSNPDFFGESSFLQCLVADDPIPYEDDHRLAAELYPNTQRHCVMLCCFQLLHPRDREPLRIAVRQPIQQLSFPRCHGQRLPIWRGLPPLSAAARHSATACRGFCSLPGPLLLPLLRLALRHAVVGCGCGQLPLCCRHSLAACSGTFAADRGCTVISVGGIGIAFGDKLAAA